MKRQKIIREYFQMWIDNDGSKLSEIFAKDAVYTESYGPRYLGSDQIAQWFLDWHLNGKVLQWNINNMIEYGSVIIVEWYFKCVFGHELSSFDGVSLISFDDNDKIRQVKEFQSQAEHVYPYGMEKGKEKKKEQE